MIRVHTRFMASARRSGRQPGKSDPIDALTVVQAALREPDLSVAALDGQTRQVKLLSDHRHDLIVERTKVINRLRWHLHELDPHLTIPPCGVRSYRTMDTVAARLDGLDGLDGPHRWRPVWPVPGAHRAGQPTGTGAARPRPRPGAHSAGGTRLRVLSAATILGETAGASRFRSKDAYARFTDTAPIPVWSDSNVKVRLNRGGNLTINHALHMIAVTQTRGFGPGKGYYESVVARGKTRKEALRLLRRRLSDVVLRALLTDERARNHVAPIEPAAA